MAQNEVFNIEGGKQRRTTGRQSVVGLDKRCRMRSKGKL